MDHTLSLVLWVPLFLGEQGHNTQENTANQDNKSTMLLAKNGKMSHGKRSRALNIQCFYIADQIKHGNIKIRHCNADKMTSDCVNKGPQGVKFRKFGNQIVGFDEELE